MKAELVQLAGRDGDVAWNLVRTLGQLGAELIIVTNGNMAPYGPTRRTAIMSRAMENQAYADGQPRRRRRGRPGVRWRQRCGRCASHRVVSATITITSRSLSHVPQGPSVRKGLFYGSVE